MSAEKFAKDYGQPLWGLEVHGNISQEIPNMKANFRSGDREECCKCAGTSANDQDTWHQVSKPTSTVKNILEIIVHIRLTEWRHYPYQQLFDLIQRYEI